MITIEEAIEIMTEVYDEGQYEKLDRGTAERVVMYLELLRDLMNDCGHYVKSYEGWQR